MLFKSFIPFAHAQSVYEIEPEFFVKNGVKTLFIDLDNTLDSYRAEIPKQETIDMINKIKAAGVNPVVISNNKGHRVGGYVEKLGIDYVFSAKKPFAKKINKYIEEHNLAKEDVMLVGDQMMTDVLAAHNAHIRVVLTEKLVKEDQWTTHINRVMDRPIRRYHRKRGNLKDWRSM